jgi:BA14K-like protein
VHLRSLALLLAIFGVSAALAGYVGKRYEPVAQHQAQPATPVATPAATPAALPSRPATATAPAPPQPEAVVVGPVPGPELRQPMTLQSALQNNTPRDVAPPSRSAAQAGASTTAEAPGTTGARDAASPKCNQEACAAAYRSFDASDCTYMPSTGPRRLCNKR